MGDRNTRRRRRRRRRGKPLATGGGGGRRDGGDSKSLSAPISPYFLPPFFVTSGPPLLRGDAAHWEESKIRATHQQQTSATTQDKKYREAQKRSRAGNCVYTGQGERKGMRFPSPSPSKKGNRSRLFYSPSIRRHLWLVSRKAP